MDDMMYFPEGALRYIRDNNLRTFAWVEKGWGGDLFLCGQTARILEETGLIERFDPTHGDYPKTWDDLIAYETTAKCWDAITLLKPPDEPHADHRAVGDRVVDPQGREGHVTHVFGDSASGWKYNVRWVGLRDGLESKGIRDSWGVLCTPPTVFRCREGHEFEASLSPGQPRLFCHECPGLGLWDIGHFAFILKGLGPLAVLPEEESDDSSNS
jgi:hypothetical protein